MDRAIAEGNGNITITVVDLYFRLNQIHPLTSQMLESIQRILQLSRQIQTQARTTITEALKRLQIHIFKNAQFNVVLKNGHTFEIKIGWPN